MIMIFYINLREDILKKSVFLKVLCIVSSIFLILGIALVVYIYNLLVRYEASQPERVVEAFIDEMEKRAFEGTVEERISFDGYEPPTSEQKEKEISAYISKLKGELRYEEVPGVTSGLVFNIKNEQEVLATVTLESKNTKTVLIVFNFEDWEIVDISPAKIDKELEHPASVVPSIKGSVIPGEKNPETGNYVYPICSLTTPEIILTDPAGNKVTYDTKKKTVTYGYTVSIPSDYKLYADGTEVDSNIATSEKNPEFEYVSVYCDSMPAQLTYDMYFLSNSVELKVEDNAGNDVPFEMENRSVTIVGQSGAESVPAEILAQIDVLDAAKQWSRFMTKDLAGTNYGYSTIKKLLIEDSYLQGVAWKWATGIDITFTSIHTLGPTPFIEESVSNYIKYSDDCFSCDVKFKKHMILSTGAHVYDPMDSTFYFVNIAEEGEEPQWRIADIRENVNTEAE